MCSDAQEEHARDLPNMNGIKEDIKSIGVIDLGTDAHLEAMTNISSRLITLLVNIYIANNFINYDSSMLAILSTIYVRLYYIYVYAKKFC